MTIVHLEFRDEELHFDIPGTPAPAEANYGHHWQGVLPESELPCENLHCDKNTAWARWTVAHPNVTDVQFLCPEHAYGVAKATPSLRAVLCARDPHSEFEAVLWEQDVQADFPIY